MNTKTPPAAKFSRRYPWKEWFARKDFILVRGKEFDRTILPHTFAQMVRNAAAYPSHNVRVKIRIIDDNTIEVRVFKVLPRKARSARRATYR